MFIGQVNFSKEKDKEQKKKTIKSAIKGALVGGLLGAGTIAIPTAYLGLALAGDRLQNPGRSHLGFKSKLKDALRFTKDQLLDTRSYKGFNGQKMPPPIVVPASVVATGALMGGIAGGGMQHLDNKNEPYLMKKGIVKKPPFNADGTYNKNWRK